MSKTADQYYQGLGRRIRAHRLMRGVSQETLGQQLGVTFQQIQKYENGANRVSAGRLLQIASFLKVDPAVLLVDGEAQAKSLAGPTSPLDYLENARALRMLQAFAEINDAKIQNLIVELCQALAVRDIDRNSEPA